MTTVLARLEAHGARLDNIEERQDRADDSNKTLDGKIDGLKNIAITSLITLVIGLGGIIVTLLSKR